MTRPLGLLGLGLMGQAIAFRARQRGIPVAGYDPREERRADLDRMGMPAKADAGQVLDACGTVIYAVLATEQVRDSLQEHASRIREGHRIVDTTTGDPDLKAELARLLSVRQAAYLDASLAGSSSELRQGRAMALVGGPPSLLEDCRPLLESFCSRIFHLGEAGSGARMKLVFNLVLGLNRAALAEGLSLAGGLGLCQATTLRILKEGSAYSRAMDAKGERMLQGDFDRPQARLSQHRKDVQILLQTARRHGAPLPLSAQHLSLLDQAIAAGAGDLDNSAILQAYSRHPESKQDSPS